MSIYDYEAMKENFGESAARQGEQVELTARFVEAALRGGANIALVEQGSDLVNACADMAWTLIERVRE